MKYGKYLAMLSACAFCAWVALAPVRAWADVKINATNFPDENFRRWVKENAAGGKNILTDAQIAVVEEMDLSFGEISSLKGIERFTALKDLACWSNNLAELDMSRNVALEILRCNGNELTRLNLPKNAVLNGLYCDQNELAMLDLSGLPDLYALSCRYNGIKTLDVSHNPALAELDCWGNEITSLDLSKNVALTKLNCLENPIKKLDLSKNRELSEASLPETATVLLPGGDKIAMRDFKVTKHKDGKYRLNLSKYGAKIGEVCAEPEGEDEIDVKSVKGVHTFAPFAGKLIVPYKLRGDDELNLILFIEGE